MSMPVQKQVQAFVVEHGLQAPVAHRLLDAAAEFGEVAKALLIATNYGKSPFVADDHFAEELGDLFFSLLCIANSAGVDLEAALQTVLAKYQQRLSNSGDVGSGAGQG